MLTKDKCMKKLTKEEILNFPNTCYGRMLGKQLSNQVVGELLQYKQLEEEIDCPLEVVFKALKNGIWYEDVANRMTHIGVGLDTANYECEYLLREYDNAIRFLPRNYKKTWWLKANRRE